MIVTAIFTLPTLLKFNEKDLLKAGQSFEEYSHLILQEDEKKLFFNFYK